LLTCGFKTIPKYHFWEILIFGVENFVAYEEPEETNQEATETLKLQQIEEIKTQILMILDGWRDKSIGREKEAVKKAIKQLSNDKIPLGQQYNIMELLLNTWEHEVEKENRKLKNLVDMWESLNKKPAILSGN
jgi:hypothetical protein